MRPRRRRGTKIPTSRCDRGEAVRAAPVEALLTDLRVAIPIDEPSVEEPVAPPVPAAACFVFAPTTEGYRLVPLDGLPEPGATVDIPEVGERVVLRVGPRPIPGDKRLFAFVEEPVTAPVELAVH